MFQVEADAPLNGAATPDKPLGFYDAEVGGGWEIPHEPYTVAPRGAVPLVAGGNR